MRHQAAALRMGEPGAADGRNGGVKLWDAALSKTTFAKITIANMLGGCIFFLNIFLHR
jgi:hypothetical protein